MTMHTILVIEDDPDLCLLLQLELQAEGYEVKIVQDGMQGLLEAKEVNPDLILLDRSLPRMDGIEVCKRIRETSQTPILMFFMYYLYLIVNFITKLAILEFLYYLNIL